MAQHSPQRVLWETALPASRRWVRRRPRPRAAPVDDRPQSGEGRSSCVASYRISDRPWTSGLDLGVPGLGGLLSGDERDTVGNEGRREHEGRNQVDDFNTVGCANEQHAHEKQKALPPRHDPVPEQGHGVYGETQGQQRKAPQQKPTSKTF